MAKKISTRNVEAIASQTILWDSCVRGFHARRQYGDAITFAVFYRNQEGLQRWHKIGRYGVWTVAQARQEAQRILRARDLGEDPTAARQALRDAITMAQLCDDYLANGVNLKKASTLKSDISRIEKHIRPVLGQRKVTGITQEDVENFMRSMTPGSAGRVTNLLGAIFSYAVKRKLRTDNPAHGVEKPAEVKRTRRLSDAEYGQLWSALQNKNVASEVILFLAITGWRSSEAKNLKFAEVDLERRTAILGDTKTGTSIRPLSSLAVEIIKRQRVRDNQQFVFEHKHAQPINNLTSWWIRLRLDKTITPHTLRHSFASLAGDMSLADSTIAGLLGHARSSITSRYIHLDKALIAASDLVAGETLRLMQGSAADDQELRSHPRAIAP
jgi:integrase